MPRISWTAKTAVVTITFGLAFGVGAAADHTALDGHWWQTIPESQAYVAGATMVGYEEGWRDGVDAEGARIVREVTAKFGKGTPTTIAVFRIQSRDLPNNGGPASWEYKKPTFSHTYGFYEAAITDYYLTHPDRLDDELGGVVSCLADDPTPVSWKCPKK